jgi:hypothetical protein
MAETTDDVRRDIELTRARMSSTLDQLETKLNIKEMVRDNPWPAIALAVGAGVVLSGSGADVKAAAATATATRGASSKLGDALDDIVAQVMAGLHGAMDQRIESLVRDVKMAIGAPVDGQGADTDRTDRLRGMGSDASRAGSHTVADSRSSSAGVGNSSAAGAGMSAGLGGTSAGADGQGSHAQGNSAQGNSPQGGYGVGPTHGSSDLTADARQGINAPRAD